LTDLAPASVHSRRYGGIHYAFDYDNFRKYLNINWDEAMKSCRSIDDMWEYFKQKLLTGTTEFIPRSKHFSKNIKKDKKNFQPFNLQLKTYT